MAQDCPDICESDLTHCARQLLSVWDACQEEITNVEVFVQRRSDFPRALQEQTDMRFEKAESHITHIQTGTTLWCRRWQTHHGHDVDHGSL